MPRKSTANWKSTTTALIGGLAIAVLLCGCRPAPKPPMQGSNQANSDNIGVVRADRKLIEQAIGFMQDQDRFLPQRVKEESIQRLNRWLSQKGLDPDWEPDPMVDQLDAEFRDRPRLQNLATRLLVDTRIRSEADTLRGSEFDYFQGIYWCKQVSDRIAAQTPEDTSFRDWLRQAWPDLGPNQRNDLDLAVRLFDWTVRNIHPVRLRDETAEKFAPGTSRDFWAALQTGEGDPLERARVFIQLARQQGLSGAMVSLGEEGSSAANHLLVGILVSDDLFLFDPHYGLPVSDSRGEGIVGYSQLVANPEILQAMATETYRYPIRSEDLAHISVWLDAPSTSLTQATLAIENELTAEYKMSLHFEPSRQAAALQAIEGIDEVRLWTVPFQAEQAIATFDADPNLKQMLITERWMFDNTTPFAQARFQELAGRLGDEVQRPGARSLYLAARRMERELARVPAREIVRQLEAQGMQFPDDPQAAQNQLARVQQSAVLWKERSSVQLGVIALGEDEYRSAIDYFQKRVLDEFPGTGFKSAAYYGLGRAYEALGRQSEEEDAAQHLEMAIQYYTSDDDLLSPYRRGNIVRAERLRQRLEPPAAGEQQERLDESPEKDMEPDDTPSPEADEPATPEQQPESPESAEVTQTEGD